MPFTLKIASAGVCSRSTLMAGCGLVAALPITAWLMAQRAFVVGPTLSNEGVDEAA